MSIIEQISRLNTTLSKIHVYYYIVSDKEFKRGIKDDDW
jgi:hypothetical protein